MTRILTCDERVRRGLSAGEFATTYWPATGQEAIAAALGTVLRTDDQLVTTYRGLQYWHAQLPRGVVDTRAVVFHVSATLLFLFLTLRVVESRRWK